METNAALVLKPLGFNPFDPAAFAVPCLVLGLGEKTGVTPASFTAAQFESNNAKGWYEGDGTLRPVPGTKESPEKEGGNTQLRVAPLRNGRLTVDDPAIQNPTNQDGGNGSGGDSGAGNAYHADMVLSRRSFTFWKRASNTTKTPLGTSSNASIASIYTANFDPGFARVFPSHQDASEFLANKGKFVYDLFEYVLLVAVRADLSTFVREREANEC